MKLQPNKASGPFVPQSRASRELIIHMEADPGVLSFAGFDFRSILPPDRASSFDHLSACLLRHEVGVFVIAVKDHDCSSTQHLRESWLEADRILARRNIWLFSASSETLRAEPHWSNAQRVASCARAEVHPRDKARVIDFLAASGHAPLIECVRRSKESRDSCDAALQLVSPGTLHFDRSTPLSFNSAIRLRPFSSTESIPWLWSSEARCGHHAPER